MFFRVVDESTRQPLPGVTLKVWIDGKDVRQHVTDESGRILIPLPQASFDRLVVTARMEGMAPMKVYLWRSTCCGARDSSIVYAGHGARHVDRRQRS